MIRRIGINAIGSGLIMLALLPAPALPASPSTQQLDEVLVNGRRVKPNRDPQQIVNWLKLLVGQFRYTGFVEVKAEGVPSAPRQVRGKADCIAFGLAPGVICRIDVNWPEVHGPNGEEVPGGISSLTPAMVQYGLDADRLAIRYMQVDNKGMADRGHAYLVSDSLVTTAPCMGIEGNCQRISRITPQVDGRIVEMQVDFVRDSEPIASYRFVLRRVGAVAEGAISGGEP
jgi:hypothetical protein